MGLASLLKMMWADEYVDERDARFINDRVHANIQRDGTFSVVPQMKGGVTTPAQLRRIADVAEKYDVPMVKLTGGQRIDLLGVRKEDLPEVWADLDMPSGYAYGKSFRTVKTCVGSDFCRFGVGDSTSLGHRDRGAVPGHRRPGEDEARGHRLPRATAPRRCARTSAWSPSTAAAGRSTSAARPARTSARATCWPPWTTPDQVVTLTGRFLQYYRENAKWLERTYAWVPRFGIEKIRAVVVDDSEGIGERLDAEMQKAVDAYRDPWKEGEHPATPGQFRTSLPLTALPQVARSG